jgi:nitroreductase
MRNYIRKLVEKLLLEINCFTDYLRFKKYSSSESKNNKNSKELSYWILQDKHRIEKALSLPEPRASFGKAVIGRLTNNLLAYSVISEPDRTYCLGISALDLYKQFHINNDYAIPEFYDESVGKLNPNHFVENLTHDVGVHLKEASKVSFYGFDDFAKSRSSCRNYIVGKNVDEDLIVSSVQCAIKTPSVCNRQHWKLHFFSNELKDKILSLQNGNAGFGNTAPHVVLVTSELSAFYTANERNQPFTDGGMFAMSFIYSLESKGIASCPLNWCSSFFADKHFRKLNLIPDSEVVVMAILFGYAKDESVYANSPKIDLNKFYTIN